MTRIPLTVFTSASGPLSKTIKMGADSKPESGSNATMARGTARRVEVDGVTGMAELINNGFASNQSLALGCPRLDLPNEELRVTTEADLNGQPRPNTIARTARDIIYVEDQPAFALFDYDTKGAPQSIRERVRESGYWNVLVSVVPELADAARMERGSTSAGLYRTDTEETFRGGDGVHEYVIASDGTKTKTLIETVHDRCWLADLGWYFITKAGRLSERSLVDRTVAGPERLVFEGPPMVLPPLAQRAEERMAVSYAGHVIDVNDICALTPEEMSTVRRKKNEMAHQMEPERRRVEETFEANSREKMLAMGLSAERVESVLESMRSNVLLEDFELSFMNPDLDVKTVKAVLDDPEHFKDERLRDPLEPEHGFIAKVLLMRDGRPMINSFNHGGAKYQLRRYDDAVGVRFEDFYAYMPAHSYIFTPTREMWATASVNSKLPSKPVLDENGQPVLDARGNPKKISANTLLDRYRSVEQMTWAPGMDMLIKDRLIADGGWIGRKGVTIFNLYLPPTIELGDKDKAGLWIDHIKKIYPDDYEDAISWFAYKVQRPGEKINHAVVLGGAPGIGKDTILEPVKRAIGPWNFKEISPQQVLGSFNGFLKSVVLRVNEARDLGDFDRFKFYDHTKSYIAAPPDVLRVNEKNLKEYYVLNCVGVIFTTNHKTDGLYLPADDRRHYVMWSDAKPAEFSKEYWDKLWAWYGSGGYGHVAAYLSTLDISSFNPKAPPPKTEAFWEIVNANRSTEDAELEDAIDAMGKENSKAITLLDILAHVGSNESFKLWLKDRKNWRSIPHRLDSIGYVPVRNPDAGNGLWKIDGRKQVIYAKKALTLREQLDAARKRKEQPNPI